VSTEPNSGVSATVAIVTRNRREELRGALSSCVAQTVDCELLVIDDGSEDGTSEMVAAEFPDVRLLRSELRQGFVIQRNLAIRAACAPVIFFLDDDAAFSSEHVVAQTLPAFDEPDVAAVSIPHMDLVDGQLQWSVKPASPGAPQAVRAFVGCANAVRRSTLLEVEGYRKSMTGYGEESELCLRLLNCGSVVLLGSSDPIHHFRSSLNRSKYNEFRARTRNTVFTALINYPGRALPRYLTLVLAYVAFDVIHDGYPLAFGGGIIDGCRAGWRHRRERNPVSMAVFRLAERLRRHEPLSLETVRAALRTSHRVG
jgi:GT2 family glycosyltransferase